MARLFIAQENEDDFLYLLFRLFDSRGRVLLEITLLWIELGDYMQLKACTLGGNVKARLLLFALAQILFGSQAVAQIVHLGPYQDGGQGFTSAPPTPAQLTKLCDLIDCVGPTPEKFVLLNVKNSMQFYVSGDLYDPPRTRTEGVVPVFRKWPDGSRISGYSDSTCVRHGLPIVISDDMDCESLNSAANIRDTKEYWVNTLFHEARHIIQFGVDPIQKWGEALIDDSYYDPNDADSVARFLGRSLVFAVYAKLIELEAHSAALRLVEPDFFINCDPNVLPNYCGLSDIGKANYRKLLEQDKRNFEDYLREYEDKVAAVQGWIKARRAPPYSAKRSEMVREVQEALVGLEKKKHEMQLMHAKNLLLCVALDQKDYLADLCAKRDSIEVDKNAVKALRVAEEGRLPAPNPQTLICLQAYEMELCSYLNRADTKTPDDPSTPNHDESEGTNWKKNAVETFSNAAACYDQLASLAGTLEATCTALSDAEHRKYLLDNKLGVIEAVTNGEDGENGEPEPSPVQKAVDDAVEAKLNFGDPPGEDASEESRKAYRRLCDAVAYAEAAMARALRDKEDVDRACEEIEEANGLLWDDLSRAVIQGNLFYEFAIISSLLEQKALLILNGHIPPSPELAQVCQDLDAAEARYNYWGALAQECADLDKAAEEQSADGAVEKARAAKEGVVPEGGEHRVGGSKQAYDAKRKAISDVGTGADRIRWQMFRACLEADRASMARMLAEKCDD